MASIAGNTVSSFAGRLTRGRVAARVVRRNGVNGAAGLFGKWAPQPDRVVTTAYASSLAAADALAETYRTVLKTCIAGTLVTVVDGVGTSWSNVLVLDVVPMIDLLIGPTNPWCVTCTWMLLPNSDEP